MMNPPCQTESCAGVGCVGVQVVAGVEGSRHVSREVGRKVNAAGSLDNPTAWSGASGTESVEDLLGLSALPRHERMNLRGDAQAINIGLPSGWEQA